MAITLEQLSYGDLNYVGKHNANYAAIEAAVNALETQKQNVAMLNQPGGYAGLGGDGKVPASLIGAHTHSEYQPIAARGQPSGYCDLDGTGKIPVARLPSVSLDFSQYQDATKRGQPNGYASLDGSGKVPLAQIPDLSATYATRAYTGATYEILANKGATNGYCPLVGGMVPNEYLPAAPDLSPYETIAHAALTYATISSVTTSLADYLLTTTAAATYLPIATAASTYETQAHAASTYAPISTTETSAHASSTYATIASLSSYLTTATAASTYVPLSQRGAANGVATLDSGGLIPTTQIPVIPSGSIPTDVELNTNKNVANGYCPLDSGSHVPAANLTAANIPDLSATYAPKTQPVAVPVFYPGKPGNSALMTRVMLPASWVFPANLTGALGHVGTNPTATTTLDIAFYHSGSPTVTGTISISTGGVFTFATTGAFTSAAGDYLQITNQATADATCADISATLLGTR